jgi:hypothetical protein
MAALKEAGFDTVEEAQSRVKELQAEKEKAITEAETFTEELEKRYADYVE